jgi:hypothetical protein
MTVIGSSAATPLVVAVVFLLVVLLGFAHALFKGA